MKNAKKTRAQSRWISKTALLKDLRSLLEIRRLSGRTWELSVIRDAIKFLSQK